MLTMNLSNIIDPVHYSVLDSLNAFIANLVSNDTHAGSFEKIPSTFFLR